MYGFIYITTNNINGKKYIGQKKYDKNEKWKSYLGSGIAFQKAIEKYGIENFSKKIIEECESKDELNAKEKYWINYYNAVNSRDYYNIASGGDGGNVTAGYTDEEKKELSKKLSRIRKGRVNIGAKNGGARPVICLNTMKVFETIVEASYFYDVSEDAIQQCCSDSFRAKTAGALNGIRLQWSYYNDNVVYEYIPFKREYEYKKIKCLNTGDVFNSVHEAHKKTGCSVVGIRHCCVGYLKTTNKLSFEYIH